MTKILLCCSAGMSTSMLVKKMQQAAESQNLTTQIEAHSVSSFAEKIEEFDVCLLGPQVRFQLEALRPLAEQLGKGIDVISPLDYGMMKGDKVLEQALTLATN